MQVRALRYFLKRVIAIFVVSVAVNFLWEVAQAPLYIGWEAWDNIWWHCFVASLGDGLLVLIIFGLGWAAFRRFNWYVHPSAETIGMVLAAGLCIGVGVEWFAITILNRWAYAAAMPLIPGFRIGIVPVLQMLLLPPLTFRIGARWIDNEHADHGRQHIG